MHTYKLIFEDKFGIETTDCFTDGSLLYTKIRGCLLEGSSFNLFEPKSNDIDLFKNNFETRGGCIIGLFTLLIPFTIDTDGIEHHTELKLVFDYRKDTHIRISTKYGGINYASANSFGWVEDAMCHLQSLLPKSAHFHCCLSCKYSHYHPIGSNDYGSLLCIKAIDPKYHDKISDKDSLMYILDHTKNSSIIEQVLETYYCPQYQNLNKGDWMYKSYTF